MSGLSWFYLDVHRVHIVFYVYIFYIENLGTSIHLKLHQALTDVIASIPVTEGIQGFYSNLFAVPKPKGGGIHPILDPKTQSVFF